MALSDSDCRMSDNDSDAQLSDVSMPDVKMSDVESPRAPVLEESDCAKRQNSQPVGQDVTDKLKPSGCANRIPINNNKDVAKPAKEDRDPHAGAFLRSVVVSAEDCINLDPDDDWKPIDGHNFPEIFLAHKTIAYRQLEEREEWREKWKDMLEGKENIGKGLAGRRGEIAARWARRKKAKLNKQKHGSKPPPVGCGADETTGHASHYFPSVGPSKTVCGFGKVISRQNQSSLRILKQKMIEKTKLRPRMNLFPTMEPRFLDDHTKLCKTEIEKRQTRRKITGVNFQICKRKTMDDRKCWHADTRLGKKTLCLYSYLDEQIMADEATPDEGRMHEQAMEKAARILVL